MTYNDAITFIVNNGYTYKAIMDLGQCAHTLVTEMQKEKAELEAEKRTIKKFLECDMTTDQKLYAIGTLLEENNEG